MWYQRIVISIPLKYYQFNLGNKTRLMKYMYRSQLQQKEPQIHCTFTVYSAMWQSQWPNTCWWWKIRCNKYSVLEILPYNTNFKKNICSHMIKLSSIFSTTDNFCWLLLVTSKTLKLKVQTTFTDIFQVGQDLVLDYTAPHWWWRSWLSLRLCWKNALLVQQQKRMRRVKAHPYKLRAQTNCCQFAPHGDSCLLYQEN